MHASLNYRIGTGIRKFIDFFYFPFKKFCTAQFFRYGVCGLANTVFSWVLYWLLYNFVFGKQNFTMLFITFTPHIAALFMQTPITFLTGFWLSRYVSFSESILRGRTQIVRYFSIMAICILINYAGLKLFVEVLHIYPTPSQMINTVITTIFSFFSQKYFSFKA
ncbi:MAG: GtrA family protein [Prevotellaceae bacterium]|jgi:putative flippase GtrA|nr:GtrA family protein [Prevotellaceae bacterium]